MDKSEIVQETLNWCNEKRSQKGLDFLDELPKGRRRDPESCPCGLATGLQVEIFVYQDEHGDEYDLPFGVMEFVSAFDSGRFPQYDIDR